MNSPTQGRGAQMNISNGDIILRLACAALIGILFGFERKSRGKPIGVRTYSVVAISSACVAIISAYGFVPPPGTTTMDPARLVVGVLTGIGFLGAGIIWRSPKGYIQGVTSAADVWAVACFGIGVGLGHYFVTFASVILIFLIFGGYSLLVHLRPHSVFSKPAGETPDSHHNSEDNKMARAIKAAKEQLAKDEDDSQDDGNP